MIKKILIVLIALAVLLGVGAYFLNANLDSLVKAAVEKYGSAATQTDVRLASVKISVTDGKGALSGFSVGNPTGFSDTKALELGEVVLQIDGKSLAGDGPIMIREIGISNPKIVYEVSTGGENNLAVLARNAKTFSAAQAGDKKTADAKTSSDEPKKAERKIVIENLYVRDGQVAISHELLKGKPLNAQLPTIHMSNIGKGSGGVTPAQVADLVIGVIAANASQMASANLTKEIGGLKNQTLKNVGDKIMNLIGP